MKELLLVPVLRSEGYVHITGCLTRHSPTAAAIVRPDEPPARAGVDGFPWRTRMVSSGKSARREICLTKPCVSGQSACAKSSRARPHSLAPKHSSIPQTLVLKGLTSDAYCSETLDMLSFFTSRLCDQDQLLDPSGDGVCVTSPPSVNVN